MEPEELPVPTAPAQAAPVPVAPAAGGLLPVPGPIAQTSSSRSESRSGKVTTPGLGRAMEERRSAGRERLSADAQILGAAEATAEGIRLRREGEKLEAQKNLTLQKIQTKEANDILRGQAVVEQNARRQIAADEEEYRRQDKATFWGDQETWRKVLWGVSLALGGYGAALSRSNNVALERLFKTIDDWSARKDSKLKTLHQEIRSGRSKLGTVGIDWVERQMRLKPLRDAAALGQVADVMEAQAQKFAAAGDKEAEGRALRLVADARAEQAKKREEAALKEEQTQLALAPTVTATGRESNMEQTPTSGRGQGVPVVDRQTGKPVGATNQPQGNELNKAYSQLKPLETGLGKIEALVKESTFWDRVAGGFTDRQQKIEGLLNPLIPMISQATGSGTPQEGEAKRLLNTIRTRLTQGKEVTLENINNLRQMLRQAYDSRVQAAVPGYQPSAQPSSEGGVEKMVNGKPAIVYPDGTFEYK